ncbi:MAG: acetyl-CoA carboxylase biotin carboxylase subunit [Acidobacteria bacterium]|nr:MAG: acetyl-CoA carboxylase biotin carboxylase subunit [Acidobacteriota bacterium]
MFKKILIANRGEIALRIIQACRELGVETVAVHSTADRDSLHVTYAHEDVCIGPPPSSSSYLNIGSVIAAAEITGAEAVHPGYGFLAENAHFAEVLADCKIAWIGPKPETIRAMGDKANARRVAMDAGVPVLPGSRQPIGDAAEAAALADEVGYPVILKAAAGGGGRGMRIVRDPAEIAGQFATASEEAAKAFGDGSMYLEKYLAEPRHVEFQIFGDRHGTIVHLGERDCSIQRRHQKLVEESPSTALDAELRQRMGAAAVRLAEAVSYENAGTIEFLLDRDGSFYFMEMNTRIQVEHPVTEMVMGVDLVKEQIRVAAGEPLSFGGGMAPRGHAIECRINAEDPERFMPSPGRLTTLHLPGGPGIRVDTHTYQEYVIPPYYDSMVAKLIAHGRDRGEAIARLRRALDFFIVEGVKTTIPLYKQILVDPAFCRGEVSTRFMEEFRARQAGEEDAGE